MFRGFLTKIRVHRETPPRSQFLSHDQLSDMTWRRISRDTKKLRQVFEILKFRKFSKSQTQASSPIKIEYHDVTKLVL